MKEAVLLYHGETVRTMISSTDPWSETLSRASIRFELPSVVFVTEGRRTPVNGYNDFYHGQRLLVLDATGPQTPDPNDPVALFGTALAEQERAGPQYSGEDVQTLLGWVDALVSMNPREVWKHYPAPSSIAEMRKNWGYDIHALLTTYRSAKDAQQDLCPGPVVRFWDAGLLALLAILSRAFPRQGEYMAKMLDATVQMRVMDPEASDRMPVLRPEDAESLVRDLVETEVDGDGDGVEVCFEPSGFGFHAEKGY